ncbi:hypothetical protein A3A67_02905 [Candidatus Peribacteria bacterium RIFCSPLOWO2_01_FULL_51_18]|nr:MAG: hypothetical protein A3A67_02905 [Candidatus Peribacteria bacterium RIFCSPLOWO2_01_FULL_51_18]
MIFDSSTPPTFVFDFDSTLVSIESLDELIALSIRENHEPDEAGKILEEIRKITDMGMNGEIDFPESLSRRLKKAPVNRSHIKKFGSSITESITPGLPAIIKELRTKKYQVLIMSGALIDCVMPVAIKLGIHPSDVFANRAVFDESGRLTGFEVNDMAKTEGKTLHLGKLIKMGYIRGKIIMVGDGISDLEPYRKKIASHFIGVGIHKKRETVMREAPYFFTSVPPLKRHIRLLLNNVEFRASS